jgi:hypothetical protein
MFKAICHGAEPEAAYVLSSQKIAGSNPPVDQ